MPNALRSCTTWHLYTVLHALRLINQNISGPTELRSFYEINEYLFYWERVIT